LAADPCASKSDAELRVVLASPATFEAICPARTESAICWLLVSGRVASDAEASLRGAVAVDGAALDVEFTAVCSAGVTLAAARRASRRLTAALTEGRWLV
jgi:hypothetical protein